MSFTYVHNQKISNSNITVYTYRHNRETQQNQTATIKKENVKYPKTMKKEEAMLC